ncbi:hypothetical protein [Plantactinospora sp. DSM 117369]
MTAARTRGTSRVMLVWLPPGMRGDRHQTGAGRSAGLLGTTRPDSLGLARERALGAYQGLAEAATATVQIFGPALFTVAVGRYGTVGWLFVAAIFLLAASLLPVLVRRALPDRPANP